jgi:hypothetical protein
MKTLLRGLFGAAAIAVLVTFGGGFAHAADVTIGWQCSSTSASGVTTYGQCPVSTSYPLPVVLAPATSVTGNSAGTTGAVVGTLAAVSGKTTYLCGFDVSAIGGTAAVGPVVVAGLIGSSMTYQLTSTAAGVTFSRTYTPCIPASATNVAITTTTTADGTASAVDVNSWGYQQ